jgi:hypothetical protein
MIVINSFSMERPMHYRSAILPVLISCLLLSTVCSARPEFNWVPSGTLSPCDRTSEAGVQYESAGVPVTVELGYSNEEPVSRPGRNVDGTESFVVTPASWRSGPAQKTLVIVKTIDTSQAPMEIGVRVNQSNLPTWRITPPAGPRRLYDAMYVIPAATWRSASGNPRRIPVTITSGVPHNSLGYRFYVTRDWDILGDDCAFSLDGSAGKAEGGKKAYLQGLLAEADHQWADAAKQYKKASIAADASLARLARVALRRATFRASRADLLNDKDNDTFAVHYRLGLYAGACGIWDDALAEFKRASELNSTDADTTYRLAEAMEYNRMPVETFAPVYERAGQLSRTPHCNEVDVLIAVYKDSLEGMCGELSLNSLTQLQKDWRYVEQMVYGASLGAYRMNTVFKVYDRNDPPWVMQAGWIFLPSDKTVPIAGTYDYSIGTAEFGSSHAGGVDCGVNFSGGAQIGPTRSWEVWLHEWNHEFDWTCICGEQGKGYPCTHDSDGCGKQPIVSMGCGHRSSMRYYLNPAQYRRQEPSDPLLPGTCVSPWSAAQVVAAPTPPSLSAGALSDWLIAQNYFSADAIQRLHQDWNNQKKAAETAGTKPPHIASEPLPKPVPDWDTFLKNAWFRVKMLDSLSLDDEDDYVNGTAVAADEPVLTAKNDYVDLVAAIPGAPDKCVGYSRTFIYSPETQEVRIWVGYNDTANFWLNGRKICSGRYYACAKWEDANYPHEFALSGVLQKGWNVLAAKIERGGGGWGFGAHITDFDNQRVPGLTFAASPPAGSTIALYTSPAIGNKYSWDDVKDDYLEKLPQFDEEALSIITGIKGLTLESNVFFIGLPQDTAACSGSRYIPRPDTNDRKFNNYLNWDTEQAAGLRFERDGTAHDLLLVRPEYYQEFLTLLNTTDSTRAPADSIVGYIYITDSAYATTPNRTPRAVIVIDTALPDYPEDDLDLLNPMKAAQRRTQVLTVH